MRILLVTPVPPDRGGSGAIPVLLHAQVEGLRAANDVTLLSAVGDEPGEAAAAEVLRASGLDAHFADRRVPGRGVRRWRRRARMAGAWAFGPRPWRSIWFADPGVQTILERLAVEREFDVVAVEDSAMGSYRLPAGVPSVLTEHEVLRPRAFRPPPAGPRAWPGWAFEERDWHKRPRFQRAAWRRFDRVLAFGRRDATAIAELAPEVADRVRVSSFGLELPAAADPSRERPESLLFTGNFSHAPNRDAALWLAAEIMPAVLARRPGARLTIAGSNPPAEVLELAGGPVEVRADVPAIEPLIEEASVIVAPVRTGGGMRMKVLQALAAGKAVLTTPRGAEGLDCFGEPPLEIAVDAGAFAEATVALLESLGARAELGARGRVFAERHCSPPAWAARLESIYAEAIASGRP